MSERNSDEKPATGWKPPHRGRISTEGLGKVTPPRPSRAVTGPEVARPVEPQEMDAHLDTLSGQMDSLKHVLVSHARFRTIIDQADEAIFVIDPETDRFVDANETALRWLGLSRQELLQLTTNDVDVEFPLAYPESESDPSGNARDLRRSWVCNRVHRRRDGTCFPVEVAVAQRRYSNRTYTLVVARESRQQQKTEQAVRETQALHRVEREELEARIEKLSGEMASLRRTLASLSRFRSLIDQADEAIFVIDPETDRFIDANETALRWLGLPRTQLLSSTIHDVDVEFPLGCPDGEADVETEARRVQRPWVCGRVHRRRDGSGFPVEVAVTKRDFANRTYTLVVARERKKSRQDEQELRETEERYGSLFEHTLDPVYLTGENGRISEVNEAAVELWGYDREEMINVKARKLYAAVPDARLFGENVQKHGFVKNLPIRLRTKDGAVLPALLTAIPRNAGNGTFGGYQCLVRPQAEEPAAQEGQTMAPPESAASIRDQAAREQGTGAPRVAAEADELVESWSQYEEMKAGTDSKEPSIEDLLGVPRSGADSAETELIEPWTIADVTHKVPVSVEELLGVEPTPQEPPRPVADVEVPHEPGSTAQSTPDVTAPEAVQPREDDSLSAVQPEVLGVPDTSEEPTAIVQEPDVGAKQPEDAAARAAESRATPEIHVGIAQSAESAREEPAPRSHRANRRLDRPDSHMTAHAGREALRRRTPLPGHIGQDGAFQQWPLMLALGASVAIFAWTDLARLTYGYNAGFHEWLVGVRILGLALLALGALGRFWRRTATAVAVGVTLLGLVLLGAYAEFLLDFPFELGDVVPDTRAALGNAMLRVSGFTAATVLFCGWVSWRIWTEVWPKSEEPSL
ncbi:MAG: PAS domain S-box protein [Gemmatimonadota bacterium]|nr:MAG: PAS domain S-box protein [Gemmatimonadota bacterium]